MEITYVNQKEITFIASSKLASVKTKTPSSTSIDAETNCENNAKAERIVTNNFILKSDVNADKVYLGFNEFLFGRVFVSLEFLNMQARAYSNRDFLAAFQERLATRFLAVTTKNVYCFAAKKFDFPLIFRNYFVHKLH